MGRNLFKFKKITTITTFSFLLELLSLNLLHLQRNSLKRDAEFWRYFIFFMGAANSFIILFSVDFLISDILTFKLATEVSNRHEIDVSSNFLDPFHFCMNRSTSFGYLSKRNPLERNSRYKYNEGYLFVNKMKTNTGAKRKTHSRYSVFYYEFYLNKYYIYDNTIDKGLLDPFIKLLVASKKKKKHS